MNSRNNHKKNLIISYAKLTDELKSLFLETYPKEAGEVVEGYYKFQQRITKPNGEEIFVVPLETEDTLYMVKIDVKIDSQLSDDVLNNNDSDDMDTPESDSEFKTLEEAMDEEEGRKGIDSTLRCGALEDVDTSRFKGRSILSKEEREALLQDEEEEDDDIRPRDDDDADADFEPTDDDLNDVDSEFFLKNAEIPPEEMALLADASEQPKKKRGRPRKTDK